MYLHGECHPNRSVKYNCAKKHLLERIIFKGKRLNTKHRTDIEIRKEKRKKASRYFNVTEQHCAGLQTNKIKFQKAKNPKKKIYKQVTKKKKKNIKAKNKKLIIKLVLYYWKSFSYWLCNTSLLMDYLQKVIKTTTYHLQGEIQGFVRIVLKE